MGNIENAYIIHGTYGHPKENWFPWLKSELEKRGITVYLPHLPTPKGQSLETWRLTISDSIQFLNRRSIMVGHSIGPALIFDILEHIPYQICGAFLVAPFVTQLGDKKFDELNATFYKDFNWRKIKSACKSFTVYCSDNDPYVPIQKCKFVADKLETQLKIIHGAGHFNQESGYTKFEELLRDIDKLL